MLFAAIVAMSGPKFSRTQLISLVCRSLSTSIDIVFRLDDIMGQHRRMYLCLEVPTRTPTAAAVLSGAQGFYVYVYVCTLLDPRSILIQFYKTWIPCTFSHRKLLHIG